MKKKILKGLTGATLVIAMAIGVQIKNERSESIIMLENITAIAMASGETGETTCTAHPVICYVLPSLRTVYGYPEY